MEHSETTLRRQQRRKGQTLAEFALTLPILLVLTFGVIEFGRLFQAWVTIQNAAREATRYTTTGQYDSEKYDVETLVGCDHNLDLRGTLIRGRLTPESPEVDFYYESVDGDGVYTMKTESLYATWYDGRNCEENADDLERRKDILRLASIMDVARVGAAGLSLEPNPRKGDAESIQQMMFDLWRLPAPRSNTRGYFNVVICSSRAFLDEKSTGIIDSEAPTRFVTVYEDTTINAPYNHNFPRPYCMLNEKAPDDSRETNNYGLQWLDPGGPGDRVTVVVTFNHPLITPLGLADYITMSARRSGVNESFRTSRALNAVQGSPPGIGGIDTPTPLPPTATPTASNTPTHTPIATLTPSNTPTLTPGPFDC